MDKYFMLLVCFALFGHSATGRSWGGYDDYSSKERDHHQNFNYNDWCHNAGWNWNNSWEDSWNDSNESYGWGYEGYGDDKIRSTRTTSTTSTTSRNVAMVVSNTDGRTDTEIRAGSTGSTPSPIEVLLCLRLCPITSEYNPVCGTDNITYRNPGRLECARTCGISVSVQRFTACEVTTNQPPTTTTTTTTTTPQPPTTSSLPPTQLFFMACTRSCPVTSEYNPVCGSDNITYDNLSRFHCAKNCGKTDLFIARSSRCPAVTDLGSQVQTSTQATTATRPVTTQPTQVTPTVTELSTSSPRPTRFTTIDANPQGSNITPITSGGLGFTIPQNILQGIFIVGSTQPDYNVDERVGE